MRRTVNAKNSLVGRAFAAAFRALGVECFMRRDGEWYEVAVRKRISIDAEQLFGVFCDTCDTLLMHHAYDPAEGYIEWIGVLDIIPHTFQKVS